MATNKFDFELQKSIWGIIPSITFDKCVEQLKMKLKERIINKDYCAKYIVVPRLSIVYTSPNGDNVTVKVIEAKQAFAKIVNTCVESGGEKGKMDWQIFHILESADYDEETDAFTCVFTSEAIQLIEDNLTN